MVNAIIAKAINTLALTLFLEAGTEGEYGIDLVASVIYQRAIFSGMDYSEVCIQPKQFSCWNGQTPETYRDSAANQNREASQTWMYCLLVARNMYAERFEPSIRATHFYNPKLAAPVWAAEFDWVCAYGNHVFLMEAK